jgi:hypothetical protein
MDHVAAVTELRKQPVLKIKLPTHLWHAKRLHMQERWGYVLARCRSDRGERAAYYSMKNACTLHDASYIAAVQISGSQEHILAMLRSMTDPAISRIGNESFLSGNREGAILLYHFQTFPLRAIAPVRFLWQPSPHNQHNCLHDSDLATGINPASAGTTRRLWLWVHGCCYQEAVEAMRLAASYGASWHAQTRPPPNNGTAGNANAGAAAGWVVEVHTLQHQLCRFELVGDASHSIVRRLLGLRTPCALLLGHQGHQGPGDEGQNTAEIQRGHLGGEEELQSKLMRAVQQEQENCSVLLTQRIAPAALMDGRAISVSVTDPRLEGWDEGMRFADDGGGGAGPCGGGAGDGGGGGSGGGIFGSLGSSSAIDASSFSTPALKSNGRNSSSRSSSGRSSSTPGTGGRSPGRSFVSSSVKCPVTGQEVLLEDGMDNRYCPPIRLCLHKALLALCLRSACALLALCLRSACALLALASHCTCVVFLVRASHFSLCCCSCVVCAFCVSLFKRRG